MERYATSTQSGTKVVDNEAFKSASVLATDYQAFILDDQWAKQAFLVPVDNNGKPLMADIDIKNRTFSTTYLKFEDTTLGGSFAINAKPQFTRYSDVRSKGLVSGRQDTSIGSDQGKLGMGRYYGEAIHDHSQVIYMRFGVPQYNSLTTFFTGFYNTGAGRLARTGRMGINDGIFSSFSASSILEKVGFAIGLVAQVVIWPIAAVHAIGYIGKFFFGRPTSKYYYLKPTMFTYWGAVNNIVNNIATGRGFIPIVHDDSKQKIGEAYKLDSDGIKQLSNLFKDGFSEDGGYDIYKTANRAERLRIIADRQIYEATNNISTNSSFFDLMLDVGLKKLNDKPNDGFINAMQVWLNSGVTNPEGNTNGVEMDIRRGKAGPDGKPNKEDQSWWSQYRSYLTAEHNDGAGFAGFRVDYTGPVSESFSNSVRQSDIASKINGMSSSAKSTNFSFAGGGNTGIGVLDAVISGAKSVATGVADSMQVSGLVALAGSAFVDIPQHWESSSASLPKSSYTMKLISPYGNVYSQMQNIYIPLAMILAGALPLSTGKQSYTSPFICELYDKGRHQTRLGIIDSLSITRGTTNLGFNKNQQAMGINVTFSVVDMSNVLHMQVSGGFTVNDENGPFDEQTVFTDYMNTLAGLGLKESFYKTPRLQLQAARRYRNLQSITSPAAWALFVNEKTPVGWLDAFYKGTGRQ